MLASASFLYCLRAWNLRFSCSLTAVCCSVRHLSRILVEIRICVLTSEVFVFFLLIVLWIPIQFDPVYSIYNAHIVARAEAEGAVATSTDHSVVFPRWRLYVPHLICGSLGQRVWPSSAISIGSAVVATNTQTHIHTDRPRQSCVQEQPTSSCSAVDAVCCVGRWRGWTRSPCRWHTRIVEWLTTRGLVLRDGRCASGTCRSVTRTSMTTELTCAPSTLTQSEPNSSRSLFTVLTPPQ